MRSTRVRSGTERLEHPPLQRAEAVDQQVPGNALEDFDWSKHPSNHSITSTSFWLNDGQTKLLPPVGPGPQRAASMLVDRSATRLRVFYQAQATRSPCCCHLAWCALLRPLRTCRRLLQGHGSGRRVEPPHRRVQDLPHPSSSQATLGCCSSSTDLGLHRMTQLAVHRPLRAGHRQDIAPPASSSPSNRAARRVQPHRALRLTPSLGNRAAS